MNIVIFLRFYVMETFQYMYANALHFNIMVARVPNRPAGSPPRVAIMRALTSHCGVYYRPAKYLYVINTTALTFPISTSIAR